MTESKTLESDGSFDETIQEELEQLSYWSHGDHVEIEIVKVRQNQANTDKVKVTFDPPAGDEFTREMVVPKDPSHETEFTALLRTVGRNYDTADGIIGERVPANYTDDGWEIAYEEPDLSLSERFRRRFNIYGFLYGCAISTTILLWPIAAPISLTVAYLKKEDAGFDIAFFLAWAYMMATILWVASVSRIVGALF